MLLPLVGLSVVLSAAPSADPVGRYPRPELLMEAAELAKPEAARSVRILDARPRKDYLAGHLPQAVWVDAAAWAKAFAQGQDREAWAGRLGQLGLTADSRVVVYDDGSARDAARIWWILRYWGLADVRLLNGGWRAWQEGGYPISREEPTVKATTPQLTAQSKKLATKDQVLETVKSKTAQICDARSRAEHTGEAKMARRGGAIPGSVHLEWSQVLDERTGRFKQPAELARLFRDTGLDLNRPAVTYCQSGGRAAVLAFALELMGAREVSNYYKSWAEWGNDEAAPLTVPSR